MAEPAAGMHHLDTLVFASRSWTADARQLAPIRTQVRGWLAPLVLPGDAEDDIVVAVSEAATNCVEHAYPAGTSGGTVELTFWTEAPYLCLEIVDHGTWRPPRRPPSQSRTGNRDDAPSHDDGSDPLRPPRHPSLPQLSAARHR